MELCVGEGEVEKACWLCGRGVGKTGDRQPEGLQRGYTREGWFKGECREYLVGAVGVDLAAYLLN